MVLWSLGTSTALACGGFFCDSINGSQPGVEQAGEIVVFEQSQGQVTMFVTVAYEGPADEFAWIMPLPAEPEIGVGAQRMFDQLQINTGTVAGWTYNESGCRQSFTDASDADTDADADSDADADTDYGGGPEVFVVQEEQVGPYDSVVLKTRETSELVDWLQLNGYNVPDSLDTALVPYLTPDAHFLALKLSKGKETGDLTPVRLQYAAERPSIPIQLTSVAAVDDMPLTVYMMGEARGVPLSYLHVELNPLAFDYFNAGLDFDAQVADAADEAGGRAFTTLYADETPASFFYFDDVDATQLSAALNALEWVTRLQGEPWFSSVEMLRVLREHAPSPGAIDENQFYTCPDCYEWLWTELEFDAVAATEDLLEFVVEPHQDAQAMFDRNPMTTRMQSAMSPGEMTVDPVFGWNADLPTVTRTRSADMNVQCVLGQSRDTGARTIAIDDHVFPVPTLAELPIASDLGLWLADRIEHSAIRVEQLSEQGPPDIIADYTDELDWIQQPPMAADPNRSSPIADACGCGHTGPTGAALGLLATLGLALRRRASLRRHS